MVDILSHVPPECISIGRQATKKPHELGRRHKSATASQTGESCHKPPIMVHLERLAGLDAQ